MKFLIQPGNPLWNPSDELAAEDLSEAIEAIFPMDTEDAMMIWGDASVSLSYKYDMSVIIEDVLFMLEALTTHHSGEETVFFSSDTFTAEWHLKWHGGVLFIHPVWKSVSGNKQAKLSELGVMEVSAHHFFRQWTAVRTVMAVIHMMVMMNHAHHRHRMNHSSDIPAGCPARD